MSRLDQLEKLLAAEPRDVFVNFALAMEYFKAEGMEYVRIETLDQNPVGQRFYPSYGFKEVARQIHYIMPVRGD